MEHFDCLCLTCLISSNYLRLLIVLLPSSKQVKETRSSSSEDDPSPPPVLPLMLDFSPEKAVIETVEDKLKEAEVQNQLTEERQTKEVRKENPYFYGTTYMNINEFKLRVEKAIQCT